MRSWAMSVMSSLPGLSDPGQCMLLSARIDWACIPGGEVPALPHASACSSGDAQRQKDGLAYLAA